MGAEQTRNDPVLNGESRIELVAHIDTILKMAEHFKKVGERKLDQECRNTANRMLDLILFKQHGIPDWTHR